METKLQAVFSGEVAGVRINVSEICRQLGISRETFYKYRRRYREQGPPGLLERSRAPHRSPHLMAPGLEDEIVRLRKELRPDNGAQSIAWALARSGLRSPAVSTVHRALVRRGLVTPQPHKRPKSAGRRFVWPRPNDAWQIDATCWVLRDGSDAWVMDVLDDHSRLLTAARAWPGPSSAAAWDAFSRGAEAYGLPARVMSDNGSCFTGRFSFEGGNTVDFERDLAGLGIVQILSSPGHPQNLREDRALPPDAQGLARPAAEGVDPRRAAGPARHLPRLLQPATPPPGARRPHSGRGLLGLGAGRAGATHPAHARRTPPGAARRPRQLRRHGAQRRHLACWRRGTRHPPGQRDHDLGP